MHGALWLGRAIAVLVIASVITLLACSSQQPSEPSNSPGTGLSEADRRLLDAENEPQNWLMHGGTYREERYSSLAQISADNVAGLGLAWSFELDTNRGQQATPLIVDGVLYTTTAWSKVVALDAATGRKLWQYDPKVPGEAASRGCCDVVSRGATWYDGLVISATLDGRLIALDARDGRVVWSTMTVDDSWPYTITGAPRVMKGKVIIGNSGADTGVRGYVTAYDARTGQKVWRFYTVPGNPANGPDGAASDDVLKSIAAPTWSGEWWQAGGGGTIWDAIVYDAELDQLYIGVGNGSPWNHQVRSAGQGDNLFLSSIVALDAETGRYRWHYQVNPGETWDYTATQPIILATLRIEGRDRQVLMQAPKNGFFYVIDRHTGKLISARNFVPVNWATGIDQATGRPMEVPAARYRDGDFVLIPGPLGGHNWHPMTFNRLTGLVYMPIQESALLYANDPDYRYQRGLPNLAIDYPKNVLPDDPQAFEAVRDSLVASLIAWDPVAQREVWRVPRPGPGNGGTLTTAGNLVFQGTSGATFEALDARTGRKMWQFKAHTTVLGSPVSYRVRDQQYVAVLTGEGGGYAIGSPFLADPRRKPNGRVLAFRLGGTASLPRYTAATLPPANPPAAEFTAEQVRHGARIFAMVCSHCHGAGAISGGVLPDLRRSGFLPQREAWEAVVLGGLLADRGMASYAGHFSREDVEAVRAYVAQRAVLLRQREDASR